PRLRPEDVYLRNCQGVIETDDGARIAFDYRGYGRARDYGREVVGTAFHSTGDERYGRLNPASPVLGGEGRDRQIRLEVAELVWESLGCPAVRSSRWQPSSKSRRRSRPS